MRSEEILNLLSDLNVRQSVIEAIHVEIIEIEDSLQYQVSYRGLIETYGNIESLKAHIQKLRNLSNALKLDC